MSVKKAKRSTRPLVSASTSACLLLTFAQPVSPKALKRQAGGGKAATTSSRPPNARARPKLGAEGAAGPRPFSGPIPDFTLTDQDGRRVRFYTDLIKAKVVVLSFFYTTCSLTCDMQGRNLAKLQELLGNRLGKEVFLVSVTRNPSVDTPRLLGKWAKAHKVGDGWSLVTGDPKDVGGLVARFLSDTIGPAESHSATVFVGNDATGTWAISNGLAPPEELLGLVDMVSGRAQERPHVTGAEAGGGDFPRAAEGAFNFE